MVGLWPTICRFEIFIGIKIGDNIKGRKSNLTIDITNIEAWYSVYKFNYISVDEIRLHNLINIK